MSNIFSKLAIVKKVILNVQEQEVRKGRFQDHNLSILHSQLSIHQSSVT